jgi:hypothetical protein
MTHDVFISYSAKDKKIVEGLSAFLEQNKIRCWIAYRDIPAGKDWAEYILPAIKECKLMIYVHSSRSNASIEINKEIALCLKEQHPIIPFRIQDIDYSDVKAYHLTTINHIDAFPNPKESFGELLTKIQNLFPGLRKDPIIIDPIIKKDNIWLMKILSKIGLFKITNKQVDNIKELQKQSSVKHKKKLIGIILCLFFLVCVFWGVVFFIGYESLYEYDTDVGIVESTNVDNYSVLQKKEWRENMERIMKNVTPDISGRLYKGESREIPVKRLGILLFKNGDSYWGEWYQYKYNGIGLYITDGSNNVANCRDCKFFVGNYVLNQKTGVGTCYNESGERIYYGEFRKNKPVDTYPQSYKDSPYKFESIMYSRGNEKYIGETKNGKPHGQGIYIWRQKGETWYGTWENGQWVNNGAKGLYLLYDGTVKIGYQ